MHRHKCDEISAADAIVKQVKNSAEKNKMKECALIENENKNVICVHDDEADDFDSLIAKVNDTLNEPLHDDRALEVKELSVNHCNEHFESDNCDNDNNDFDEEDEPEDDNCDIIKAIDFALDHQGKSQIDNDSTNQTITDNVNDVDEPAEETNDEPAKKNTRTLRDKDKIKKSRRSDLSDSSAFAQQNLMNELCFVNADDHEANSKCEPEHVFVTQIVMIEMQDRKSENCVKSMLCQTLIIQLMHN